MIPESIFDKDLWLKYEIERIVRYDLEDYHAVKIITSKIIERIKQSEEKYASMRAPF